MKIKVSHNNIPSYLDSEKSLAFALESWGYLDTSVIGVAVNQEFIPGTSYPAYYLSEGDQIDVVKPISGG